ncbi:hypothetical protein EOW77_0019940 [Bradyrhizobium yuanmingense]|uniref:hypothetical protein n=1 Tax=Bradyrhizobium yuanmingense TaxID=108015 RepID=UPI000FE366D9|nr:hypothetical protein [Bradyrhizobium yuanmingense]TGN85123.1 hypothetical protein EOW77_0019940 [Bradyrhizobium yuanmingense]
MRLLVIAAAVPALSTASAQAQGRRRPNDGAEPIEVAVSSSIAIVTRVIARLLAAVAVVSKQS